MAATSRRIPYTLLNVFTDKPFGGNPLAVVHSFYALSAKTRQDIARQFNLSETVFIEPASHPAAAARVRIFTPACEIPFAGHPITGAAWWLIRRRKNHPKPLKIETKTQLFECFFHQKNSLLFTGFLAPFANTFPSPITQSQAAQLLGLPKSAVASPLLAASAGLPYTMIPLVSRSALDQIRFDLSLWNATLRDSGFAQVYAFVPGKPVHARMFCPALGPLEDPATGSAQPPLIAWHQAANLPLPKAGLTIRQGVIMQRPSTLCVIPEDGGCRVMGSSVEIGEGFLNLTT